MNNINDLKYLQNIYSNVRILYKQYNLCADSMHLVAIWFIINKSVYFTQWGTKIHLILKYHLHFVAHFTSKVTVFTSF